MPSAGRAGISHPLTHTEESRAHRVLGRIATNPITWLQHQLTKTKGVSPETLAHINSQLKRLVKRHGPLKSLPDEVAEREYLRLAYRLNYMRTVEHALSLHPSNKGWHITSKTLALYASATLKLKGGNEKQRAGTQARRAVPSTTIGLGPRATDEAKGNDDAESAG